MLMFALLLLAAITTCSVVGAITLTGITLKLMAAAITAGIVAGIVLGALEEAEPCP